MTDADALKLTHAEMEFLIHARCGFLGPKDQWPVPLLRDVANAAAAKAAWAILDRWRRSLPSTEPWEDSNPGVEYLNITRDLNAAGIPRPEEVAG